MGTLWTLDLAGDERLLADWGITEGFTINYTNKGKCTAMWSTTEEFDPATLQFEFDDKATIWRDRTAVGAGGSIVFVGWFDDPQMLSEGGMSHIIYKFHNVWWFFERQQFKQHRNQFAGWTDHDPTKPALLTDIVLPEIFLGEKVDETRQTNGQQIQEIIDWVNECYNPTRRGATGGIDATQDIVQAGTIDPQVFIPVTRVNTIFCSEALINVVRLSPDVIFYTEDSATPPKLHARTMAKWNYATNPPTFIDYTNLPEVTIDITAAQEKRITLQGQQFRKLNGCIIYYRRLDEVDGQVSEQIVTDKAPATITDYTPEISSQLVELAGAKRIWVTADVIAPPFPLAVLDGAAPGDATYDEVYDWWLAHDKTLDSDRVDQDTITFGPAIVEDEDGIPVDFDLFPNELDPGCTLPKWVEVRKLRATVKADLAFEKYVDEDQEVLEDRERAREVKHKIKLTNAVTKIYRAISHQDPGEDPPLGVAESVRRSTGADMWAGEITFVGAQARSDVYIGCRLKLIGPTTTFTNVLPQTISVTPHTGELHVTYGPSAPVDADALIELCRATRLRMVYNMPSGRSDGSESGKDEVDTGADAPADNTAHGVGGHETHGVSGKVKASDGLTTHALT